MVFRDWLQAVGKLAYVQGKDRPQVKCILCAIRDNDERVTSLKVYEDQIVFVCLNLYPYNPGHLMVVLNRHVFQFTDLTRMEVEHTFRTIQGLQRLLEALYKPHGFNIGMNQGKTAGGSIDHIHFHIVPRYNGELGYIDIVGETRVVPEGISSVREKISKNIKEFLTESFYNEF
jgi:ATP adenylyltransferase